MGTDWSPVGQIYWFTLESTNPSYDVMEKKSLEDWFIEKSFKGVKGVVDVSSFGGPTKEYQIKLQGRAAGGRLRDRLRWDQGLFARGKAVRPVSFLPIGTNGSTEELTREIGFRQDLRNRRSCD